MDRRRRRVERRITGFREGRRGLRCIIALGKEDKGVKGDTGVVDGLLFMIASGEEVGVVEREY